jgi:hypothetical protein
MRNKVLQAGILGLTLVCGLLLSACGGNVNSDIVGKWGSNQALPDVSIEYTKDGKYYSYNSGKISAYFFDFATKGKDTIIHYIPGTKEIQNTKKYAITGDTLVITRNQPSNLPPNVDTYYRK